MNRKERRAKGATGTGGGNAASAAALLAEAERRLSQGQVEQAVRIYEQVLSTDRNNPVACFNLGVVHHQRGDAQAAQNFYRRALRSRPDDGETLIALAFAALDLGGMDEALDLARQACAATPTARLLTKAGVLHREAGELDEARRLVGEALAKDAGYPEAYYAFSALQKFTEGDTLRNLRALAPKSASFPLESRIKLEFALGKALLDTNDDDAAFAHYAAANKLKKATFKVFTIEKFEKYVDSIIALFTPELVAKFRGAGIESQQPVFVVGMPRSGSTLVEQIIASHPDAVGMGEVRHWQQSVPVYPNAAVPDFFGRNVPSLCAELVRELSPKMLGSIAKDYLSLSPKSARVVDKMLFNYLWVGLILLALPNAKIIHCTRDPMATGLSIWQLLFTQPMPWAYDLGEIGRYYNAYKKLMAHWDRLFPGTILEAPYERMVKEQEAESRRLLAFCGLPWDPRCLDFHTSARQVVTASATQVRQPIYTASLDKWKKYERHLAPLAAALQVKP